MKGACLVSCCVLLCLVVAQGQADEQLMVKHLDQISVDKKLKLHQVIEQTLNNYPDRLLHQALLQEVDALSRRGDSWLAGAASISATYLDDFVADDIGYQQTTAQLDVPLWRWGQRSAGQRVAEQARLFTDTQISTLKLQVAGLVRTALWNISLENVRYKQGRAVLKISEQLVSKIEKRVELGDLPRSDYLLSRSDYLQKLSSLTEIEAELMHARKAYVSLTGITRIPENFRENLSPIQKITDQHILLQAINARIERKRAELDWVTRKGSGQPVLQIGLQRERDQRGGRDLDSAGIGINIPFGGESSLAPHIAQANLQLTQILIKREHLYRDLEQILHEAKHNLEVNEAELAIADELQRIASRNLKMAEFSYSAGEINLLDLLKIQAQTQNAIRHAKERVISKQRNIAFYNQAVGVLP